LAGRLAAPLGLNLDQLAVQADGELVHTGLARVATGILAVAGLTVDQVVQA
jgi:hypothetical protein